MEICVMKDYQFWLLLFDHGYGAVVNVTQFGTVFQLRQDVFFGIDQQLVHSLDLIRWINLYNKTKYVLVKRESLA